MIQAAAVLLDVGGTLWPDHWPRRDDQQDARLCAAFPHLELPAAALLRAEFGRSLDKLNEQLVQDTHGVIQACCARFGWAVTNGEAATLRRALCTPARGNTDLFPGARELLRTIRALDLRCVVVSNAMARASEDYRQDFIDLGVGEYVDAVISSVDAGVRKPHPAIFELALVAAGAPPERCVVVGNSEINDIQPAWALGMRTIRVAIEEPFPAGSRADAIATSLQDVSEIVRRLAGAG